ncbi:MAG: MFS transporter [Alphaproteobacteria bacterium]
MASDLGFVVRSTVGIVIAVSLFGLANGGVFALIATRLPTAGDNESLIGVLSSAYFGGTLITSIFGGWIVSRLGHFKAFFLFAALAGGATFVLSQTAPGWLWLPPRFITGLGMGGYYVVVESWFHFAATNKNRGRSLAYYETVRLASVASGSLVFLNLGTFGGIDTLTIAGALYLSAIMAVFTNRRDAPQPGRSERPKFRMLFLRAPLGAWCCLAGGMANSTLYSMVPAHGAAIGLTASALSVIVFANHFSAVAFQLPLGAISDRFGRMPVILFMGVSLAIAGGATAIIQPVHIFPLVVTGFFVGGISHSLFTAGMVHTNDRLDRRTMVHGAAAMLVLHDIGTTIGPLLAAQSMIAGGPYGLYWFFAILGLVTSGSVLSVLWRSACTETAPCCEKRT